MRRSGLREDDASRRRVAQWVRPFGQPWSCPVIEVRFASLGQGRRGGVGGSFPGCGLDGAGRPVRRQHVPVVLDHPEPARRVPRRLPRHQGPVRDRRRGRDLDARFRQHWRGRYQHYRLGARRSPLRTGGRCVRSRPIQRGPRSE